MFNRNEYLTNEKVKFPYTSFENFKKLLISIYRLRDKYDKNLDTERIANFLGLSTSVVGEARGIASELGFIYITKEIYRLTDKGNELVEKIIKNDLEEVKRIGKCQILELRKSPVLYFSYHTYTRNQDLLPYELGRQIKEKFNATWKTKKTYIRVANNGLDILKGFHLVEQQDTKKSQTGQITFLSAANVPRRNGTRLLPRISVETIKEYINKYKGAESLMFFSPVLSENQQIQVRDRLRILSHLGLIEHDKNDYYKLTEDGLSYKRAIGTPNESGVFQRILLNYEPIQFIIGEINKNKKSSVVDYDLLGMLVGKYNNRHYSDNSKRTYGIKLFAWLKEGKIVISKNGTYVLNPIILEKIQTSAEKEIAVTAIAKNLTVNQHINELYGYYFDIKYNSMDSTTRKDIIKNIEQLINILPKGRYLLGVVKDCIEDYFNTKNPHELDKAYKLIYHISQSIK